MGKIVKYCSSCDEGFAEKFGFCPNCAQPLQAFEMNPVEARAAAEAKAPQPEIFSEPAAFEQPAVAEPVDETIPDGIESAPVEEIVPAEIEAPIEEPVIKPTRSVPAAAPIFAQTTPVDVDRVPVSLQDEHSKAQAEGGYYLTVIEQKDGGTRNLLFAGALFAMLFVLMTGLVVSIFSKDLDIAGINDDVFNAILVEDVPAVVEKEIEKKNKDDGGGGGGGGREEKEETTRGDLADQTKDPIRPPDAKIPRMENPSLILPPPSTQGNMTFDKKFNKWGDPNGRFDTSSNGTGSGGGQGSGVGTGQGSGRGTGAGSGSGSGYGSGFGNGNGDGTGDGDGSPPPDRPRGVTQGIKILSKPRPGYTDAARQNNIQGTVILRVTFLASGQVGSISPVKGLGNGLTEQAIAAARRINFEPAKVNGIAQSVTKQIEYSFSIY